VVFLLQGALFGQQHPPVRDEDLQIGLHEYSNANLHILNHGTMISLHLNSFDAY
jgi:hypothetical protein